MVPLLAAAKKVDKYKKWYEDCLTMQCRND